MLSEYVTATGDKSILDRALPLAEKELQFWKNNLMTVWHASRTCASEYHPPMPGARS